MKNISENFLENSVRPSCVTKGCSGLAQRKSITQSGNRVKYDPRCSSCYQRGVVDKLKEGRSPRLKDCCYCGFDVSLAIHKHHIKKNKVILLCANCHYILHGIFKAKKLKTMTVGEVKGHLAVVYKEHSHKPQGVFEFMAN